MDMNMINKLSTLLKDFPKGTKLYSPICGDVYLEDVSEDMITLQTKQGKTLIFNGYGCYHTYADNYQGDGECLLLPSKEIRDWSGITPPCKFKPLDPIIGRRKGEVWCLDLFAYEVSLSPHSKQFRFYGLGNRGYDSILPYNEATVKLLGKITTDDE